MHPEHMEASMVKDGNRIHFGAAAGTLFRSLFVILALSASMR